MTTRIRYAVQYPPKEGSGKEPLYLGQGIKTLALDECNRFERDIFNASQLTKVPLIAEPPDSDHLPARVVKVRETITREIVE